MQSHWCATLGSSVDSSPLLLGQQCDTRFLALGTSPSPDCKHNQRSERDHRHRRNSCAGCNPGNRRRRSGPGRRLPLSRLAQHD